MQVCYILDLVRWRYWGFWSFGRGNPFGSLYFINFVVFLGNSSPALLFTMIIHLQWLISIPLLSFYFFIYEQLHSNVIGMHNLICNYMMVHRLLLIGTSPPLVSLLKVIYFSQVDSWLVAVASKLLLYFCLIFFIWMHLLDYRYQCLKLMQQQTCDIVSCSFVIN